MKQLLLLLYILPTISNTQKFSFNIGAGLGFNTDVHGMVTPLAQAGVARNSNKISVGLEVTGMHIANNYRITSTLPGLIFYDQELVYRGYSPQGFLKIRSNLKKIILEYGIQAGFFHFINYRANKPVPQPTGGYGIERKTKVESTLGLIGGIVLCGMYPISQQAGIYLKLTPQYYRIDETSKGINCSLSAGLSVKMGAN